VRLEIIAFEKLDRVGGNQRQAEFAGQIGGRGDQRLLLRLSIALHFQIERSGEGLFPARCAVRGQFLIALQERLANIAGGGARQRDQAVDADFLEHPAGDFRAPAYARREVGTRQQFAELQVARPRATEQQQAIRSVRVAVVGNTDIAAEYRLDPLAARRRVELDQTEDIGEVTECQGRHAVAGRTRNRIIEADDAVGNRILAVQAEMDERGFEHPAILPRGRAAHAPITAHAALARGTRTRPVGPRVADRG